MIAYPVDLTRDDGTTLATVPDLPGCRSYGDSDAEALANALQAARAMIAALVQDREAIPDPSPAAGRPVVRLPALDVLKVRLYREMVARQVSQSDLARRLGKSQKEVWRLLDLTHASKLDQMEAAFAALGMTMTVNVEDAAA